MKILQESVIIGKMVRRYRRERELSQTALAEALRLPQSVVSRLELGKRDITLTELRVTCAFLGVPLAEFIADYERRVEAL